jgi:glycosyltransferase involved in cell wall biosynthesis
MAEPWPAAPRSAPTGGRRDQPGTDDLDTGPSRLEVIHEVARSRPPLSVVNGHGERQHQFTVLHIVRNMGGGVATAIMDYAAAVPEARHIVLCDLERSFQVSDSFPFAVTHRMPRSFRGAVAAIRATVDEYAPDVIHAHSSFAGLYVRTGLPQRELRRVVYTPHCFAFFRRDVPAPVRAIYWLIEAMLAIRAPAIISCSPDEDRAAASLPRARTTYAPNIANVPSQITLSAADMVPRQKRHLIVSVGRMCPQKDPRLFLDAAIAARAQNLDYDWLWIGGGDEKFESLFRKHGVAFTGWVPRATALMTLAQADIYLHTAAWEGAPISVLEAAALKVPVLGRHTPALASLNLAPLWRNTGELIEMLRAGMDGAPIRQSRGLTAGLLNTHTAQAQREALLSAYAAVRARDRQHGTPVVRSAG